MTALCLVLIILMSPIFCNLVPDNVQQMKRFKTNFLKSRILSDLNMSDNQVVAYPVYMAEDILEKLTIRDNEIDILEDGQNVVLNHVNDDTRCSVRHPALCTQFQFEIPFLESSVSSVHFWMMRTVDQTRRNISICLSDTIGRQTECDHYEQLSEIKAAYGWSIFRLPTSIISESARTQRICTVTFLGPYINDDNPDQGPYIAITPAQLRERHRRSTPIPTPIQNCTCCLEEFTVNVSWTWVVAPKTFNANMCVGKCSYQLNEYPSPYHRLMSEALLQKKNHYQNPSQEPVKELKVWKPCCSPTRLSPLNMIYIAANSTTGNNSSEFVHHKIPDMRADSCACW